MSTASSAPSTAMNSTATSSADVTAASSQSDLALPQSSPYVLRYIDIGINLTDRQFHGEYHGKQVHQSDLDDIVQRGRLGGVERLMLTGSCLKESKAALKIAQSYPGYMYTTVGVHPCSAKDLTNHHAGHAAYIDSLRTLALSSPLVAAFGEIGLDYDRLYHASVEEQKIAFTMQLDLAEELGLPLFLHSRAAAGDFEAILFPRLPKLKGGLVHSFTGSMDEMKRIVGAGLYVGVNGCSLKTEENLAVMKEIPLDRLMIETDGPWCEIRPTHASSKYLKDAPALPKAVKKERFVAGANQLIKGRNEPVCISQVAYVIANVKGISVEEVCEAAWKNTVDVFGLGVKTAE
ncbi:uncharacterized protein H6S33_009507 [Morchella sextelata]|uniref:uncharacterized protein n=1 Tax=Morchella sextelata TaxID=1174677 RepID=UPI001D037059|nr:uncharacterized protein H6S33_009507 [Morchella sextelata]KAH0613127.1 hypothetical protein H6S33_009507 [Morchella sextelata]